MNDWFIERDENRLSFGYAVNQRIYCESSSYQKIEVVETKAYGKMLIIDDFVMLTEADEFVYHEMISHVPIYFHKNPERVLIIGGGDGGTVREVAKYSCVKKITLCEIDSMVVEVSQKYFPDLTKSLDDPRVNVKIGDGVAYVESLTQEYDLIIIDSTDPIGPGEGLFTQNFYSHVARALRPGGMMVAQTESPWYDKKMLQKIYQNISQNFSHTKPYIGSIPTYPRGLWSWTLASQDSLEQGNEDRFSTVKKDLKYLTPDLVKGIFHLPAFYHHKIFS